MRRLLGVLALFSCAHARPGPRTEQGRFILHKVLLPLGEETFTVAHEGGVYVLHSDFAFTDRGEKVPLQTTLRMSDDGTPLSMETRGKLARHNSVDRRIDPVPPGMFPIAGFAPVSVQQMLLQWWRAHGEPHEIATPWNQRITIERCGRDEGLVCHRIGGLIWGDEWIWTDAYGEVGALVSIDGEFDHFEAMRPDLEPHLRSFVARAAADGMKRFADVAAKMTPPPGPLAIVGARLWDGAGHTIEDAAVVVDGDRIVAAGPQSAVAIPAGARVIDGKGGTVIPGLWETHAHFEQVEWGPIYLAAGVTSARDCGNEFEFITAVRDAIESGRGIGPRLVLAGIVDGDSPSALGVDRINRPDEVEPMVERYARAGFAQMKIYGSIRPALVPEIVRAAHAHGMTVTGHVPDGMSLLEAVRAGMDMINHFGYVTHALLPPEQRDVKGPAYVEAMLKVDYDSREVRALVDELARRKTVIEPTLALGELGLLRPEEKARLEPGLAKLPPPLRQDGYDGPPPDIRAKIDIARPRVLKFLGTLHRAGVPILPGTDQAVPGHSLHRELEIFVDAGFTPAEALEAATSLPARLFHRDGTVEVGKKADLVLVDGNPLENISDTRRIRVVVARGRLYDPAPLWRSVGFTP
jgi:imidazolonepropionase-like amidohydrolase